MTTEDIVYTCPECGIEISGLTGDFQEAPILYCPDCDERLDFEVFFDG